MSDARRNQAAELMERFAARTGLSDGNQRRYLWTDAFAVCTYVALSNHLAAKLVDRVHHVLGRHRPDDSRTGLPDFATSMLPGWHATIFPPYFVAGAIFGGFAMVLVLLVPARRFFDLKDIITVRHVDNMCKILLGTGMMVGYAYSIEFFIAWYSGNPYERFVFVNRAMGPYAWAYWTSWYR